MCTRPSPLSSLFLLLMAADEVSFQEPCAHIHCRLRRRRRRISQKSCWLGKYEWPRQAALARERAEGEWQGGEAEICLLGTTSPYHHLNSYFCSDARGLHSSSISSFFAMLVSCVWERKGLWRWLRGPNAENRAHRPHFFSDGVAARDRSIPLSLSLSLLRLPFCNLSVSLFTPWSPGTLSPLPPPTRTASC